MSVRIVHAADFHLDSPYAGLSPERARQRRRDGRELLERLKDYVNKTETDLVLLSGDLFDGTAVYRETVEQLYRSLGGMQAQVFIAPGNHDWYGLSSPYARLTWPANVHIFRSADVESVELPELGAVVHGAAFTAPEQTESLLRGFSVPKDGWLHLMVLHGELAAESAYDALTAEEIAGSGLHYLALGHIHKRMEPRRIGATLTAFPGCIEGRGFDELGEKGFYAGELSADGGASLRFVPFARHHYEILPVDVTDRDPQEAVEAALPEGTEEVSYRILLQGECERLDLEALEQALAPRFETLELRDETHACRDLWAQEGEDSLRGLFLSKMRRRLEEAQTESEREAVLQAVCFGLDALDGRDFG